MKEKFMSKISQSKINQTIAKTDAARKTIKTSDSFVNLTARIGLGAGSIQGHSSYAFNFVSRNRIVLEASYRSNWVCGLAVDIVANDMTRESIDIKGSIEPDKLKIMHRNMRKLKIFTSLRESVKWDRLYGGCIAVFMIDGQDMSTPLDMDTIGKDQFKGLLVLDRWLVQPSLEDLVTEYGPEIGNPKYYTVLADAKALVNKKIHHSRVIRMEGVELPYWQKITENGWGQSVLERIWDRVIAFDSVSEGTAQLVYKAHLRVLKVSGLSEFKGTASQKTKEGFFAYWEQVRQLQSIEGLTLIDSQDEFIPFSYSFTGLADVHLIFGEQLSGGLQIPLVRLFGQSPTGLNSTGDSDLLTYYDNVSQQQEAKLADGMSKIIDVTYRSTFGQGPPEDLDFEFKPLKQMDDKEKSEISRNYAEAILKAEDQGLITKATALKELKQLSHIIGIFSNITDDEIAEAENDPPEINEGNNNE